MGFFTGFGACLGNTKQQRANTLREKRIQVTTVPILHSLRRSNQHKATRYSGPKNFFELPSEIRNRIYHFDPLCEKARERVANANNLASNHLVSEHLDCRHPRQFALVPQPLSRMGEINRQMRQEFLSYYHRNYAYDLFIDISPGISRRKTIEGLELFIKSRGHLFSRVVIYGFYEWEKFVRTLWPILPFDVLRATEYSILATISVPTSTEGSPWLEFLELEDGQWKHDCPQWISRYKHRLADGILFRQDGSIYFKACVLVDILASLMGMFDRSVPPCMRVGIPRLPAHWE